MRFRLRAAPISPMAPLLPFGLSLSKPHFPPFGLSLSKPCAIGPFDTLRVNGQGGSAFAPHQPFGLSLSKPLLPPSGKSPSKHLHPPFGLSLSKGPGGAG